MAKYRDIGDKEGIASIELTLAEIELDESDPSGAETYARAALERFHLDHSSEVESIAQAALARALLAQGDSAGADKAMLEAVCLGENSTGVEVRTSVALARAYVTAESDFEKALRILTPAVVQAQAAAFGYNALRLRLAIGEIEIKSARGNRQQAAAGLLALEQEARNRGCRWIADRAARLAREGLAPATTRLIWVGDAAAAATTSSLH